MVESFLEVANQVLILFLLVAVGFFCGRKKLFPESAVKGMTDLVLTIVVPCVIIRSFQREFDPNMLVGLGLSVFAAVCVHVLGIIVGMLFVHDKQQSRQKVMRFSIVFSNAAFMAIPLEQALLGDDGVFYGASYVAVFNLLLWSYGLALMSRNKQGDEASGQSEWSWKKIILNPGVVSVVVGVAFFVCSISLPNMLYTPVSHLANLNTPLPMLIVGYHLADAKLLKALKDPKVYLTMFLRLIAVPLITFGVFWAFGIHDTMMKAIVIAASAPVGASVTMFSSKYHQDVELSVNLVSLSTLLSILTMPLIVGLALL